MQNNKRAKIRMDDRISQIHWGMKNLGYGYNLYFLEVKYCTYIINITLPRDTVSNILYREYIFFPQEVIDAKIILFRIYTKQRIIAILLLL
jgi:hypothetical protein